VEPPPLPGERLDGTTCRAIPLLLQVALSDAVAPTHVVVVAEGANAKRVPSFAMSRASKWGTKRGTERALRPGTDDA